ncbi:hypothetical protein L466_01333 [Enterobacter sp. BIDMC 30]|nr:hypothetical protein L466_01333 [Enterobacter sp. BIDMC 30]
MIQNLLKFGMIFVQLKRFSLFYFPIFPLKPIIIIVGYEQRVLGIDLSNHAISLIFRRTNTTDVDIVSPDAVILYISPLKTL